MSSISRQSDLCSISISEVVNQSDSNTTVLINIILIYCSVSPGRLHCQQRECQVVRRVTPDHQLETRKNPNAPSIHGKPFRKKCLLCFVVQISHVANIAVWCPSWLVSFISSNMEKLLLIPSNDDSSSWETKPRDVSANTPYFPALPDKAQPALLLISRLSRDFIGLKRSRHETSYPCHPELYL